MGLDARIARLSSAATALKRSVLESSAATPVELRRAAYEGSAAESADAAIAEYVALVGRHAYRVTDAWVAELRDLGLSEDGIFDVTVAAAVGEAERRLKAGVALLRGTAES